MALAPNGLPYDRTPEAHNEWSDASSLLAKLPADVVGTVHPVVVARPNSDVGGGMGLFATFGIRKGEVVWAERAKAGPDTTAIPRSRAWIESLPPASKKAPSSPMSTYISTVEHPSAARLFTHPASPRARRLSSCARSAYLALLMKRLHGR
eukprot:6185125-Pleurochrysis_carterae.AAC.2